MSAHGPARTPCSSCPYRRDVPSGVWSAEEYEKLPEYDRETAYQPLAAFFYHRRDGRLCAGWAGCHSMADSLGLRLAVSVGILDGQDYDAALGYESPVPLFASGVEAARHGLAELEHPGPDARRLIEKLGVRDA